MYTLFVNVSENLFQIQINILKISLRQEHIFEWQTNKISKINKLQKLEINISNEELNRQSIYTYSRISSFIEINGYKFFINL